MSFLPGRVAAGSAARPAAVLLIAALAVGATTLGVTRLTTDNSPSIFFVAGSERWDRYQEVRQAFGPDSAARLVVSGPALWTDDGVEWLAELETAAAGIEGVRASAGLVGHHRAFMNNAAPGGEALAPTALRQRALANGLDRNLGWIDAEGRRATVLVTLDEAADQEFVLAALESLVAQPPPGLEASVAGSPVLDQALDASSRQVQTRESPLLVLIAVLLLAAVFRNLRGILVPLAFVAVCVGPLFGVMGWLGVSINLVLGVLFPLLFVISMATAIHLLVRFRGYRATGLEPRAAVAATYRDKGWSVLWTGVTTFVGFASLTVSPVGPVRALGLWSGLGIAWMTIAAFALFPAFLVAGRGKPASSAGRHPFEGVSRWGRRVAEWAVRRRALVIAMTAATALLAAFGVARLQTESNALTYLDPSHPARASIEALEAAGIGSALIEIDLLMPEEATKGFTSLDHFAGLSELAEEIRAEPLVLGAASAGDLLDDAVALSGVAPPLAWRGLLLDPRGRQALTGWVTPDGGRARVTVFARMVGFDRLEPLLERLEARAQERFPAAEAAVTGEFPLLLESQRALLRTLALSLALTFLAVASVFRLLLGTTRLTLLAMVPNLWPVLGVLGWMGWSGTPLDVATVMVASVLLGLAVDDTLHTLGHFRRDAPAVGAHEAVARALEQTAPSYLLTGTVLAAGFGVCAMSHFAPTARFGLLSAMGIVLAVVGDLVVVPALLGSTPKSAVRKIRGR